MPPLTSPTQIAKYKYSESTTLFLAISFVAVVAYVVFMWGWPKLESVRDFTFAAITVLFCIAVYYFCKTYLRLNRVDRYIVIDDKSITFPEHGDSLTVIRLEFNQIREIYYAEGRHKLPDNLIIKYGMEGHAYIDKNRLTGDDFFHICNHLKKALGKKEFEMRSS